MKPEIQGFMHVNVNCSNLERSRAFYEEALGLVASAHTRPASAQPGEGFGLAGEALWDAWVLDDPRGMGASASLDLLQWLTPPPVGSPPGIVPSVGIHRLGYAVVDLDDTLAALGKAGRGTLPIASVRRRGLPTRLAWALDPDGSLVEVVEAAEDTHARVRVEAREVAVVCSDLDRSVAWYESVLGLRVVDREIGERGSGASFGAPGDAVWDAARLDLAGRPDTYAIRLESWRSPAAGARSPAVANQLGPFRIALLVSDARAWHAELERLGVPCTGPPVWLDMGPDIPIDGLWAMFFFDPDGVCIELIQV